jgi:hypothetical protein
MCVNCLQGIYTRERFFKMALFEATSSLQLVHARTCAALCQHRHCQDQDILLVLLMILVERHLYSSSKLSLKL